MSNTPRRSRLLLLLLALVVLAIGATTFWPRRARPSVVLITIDALRADRLGSYGHSNRTPAIDRLAREGMLFESAYCDVPWTTASMASVMTGQYSSSHGLQLPTEKLKPEAVTMAEILHAQGFQTGAIIGSYPLDSVYGLDQGFETYNDEFSLPMIAQPGVVPEHVQVGAPDMPEGQGDFLQRKFQNDAYRPDEAVTDAAIRWLATIRDGRPFFLWVHYFGPHEKLQADAGFVEQEPAIIAAYDPDVEKADVAVGRFLAGLAALGILDKTLVVVHADHGQSLGEHGFVGHGLRIDEPIVRIPLIMRYPPLLPPGLRRVDIARNIDILPTVLAVAGGEASGLAGRSLLPERDDPRGSQVPAEMQTAYFDTLLATLVQTPLMIPTYPMVLGPTRRTGLRTPEWMFLSDEIVGPCVRGAVARRDSFSSWSIPNSAPLELSECLQIRWTGLYVVRDLKVREEGVLSEVSKEHPDVVAAMKAALLKHAERRGNLSSPITLSPEAQEKLKSLGYLH